MRYDTIRYSYYVFNVQWKADRYIASLVYHTAWTKKCIGDDTKAAARQSPNCIKKTKKINKIWRKTIFNMADWILTPCNVARSRNWFRQVTTPCSVACGSGIVTVNSLSDSTLQCDTWLWDNMPLNSPKRSPYWNFTSGFNFDHITAVDMSFCTSLQNFYPNFTTLDRKKWRHVDFQDGGSRPFWILWIP